MTEHAPHAKRLTRFFLTTALFAAMALMLAPPHSAHAATINVGCSVTELVNAIVTANGNGEADTLELATSCTYTLTAVNNTDPDYGPNGLPVITSEITINGHGSTIARSSAGGTPAFRIFQVSSAGILRLNDLTISNGSTDADGGGVYNDGGTANVANSTFSNNRGTNGGAIADVSGTVDVTDSTFSGNSAPGSAGAIWSFGTLTVAGSTFSGNSTDGTGGAILASFIAAITDSTFSGNTAGEGGAIYNIFSLTVTNSTFSNNSATGGDGGGICNIGFTPLDVTNSTFSGNSAFRWGGAIYNADTLTCTNCTLSGNSATGDADSKGGGIMHDDGGMGAATLNNTIVANSTAGGNCALGVDASAFTNGGGNLVWGDMTCPGTNANPQLGALADNGGPTQTMALLSGSAAIGAGVNANCPATDQRGMTRPQPAGGVCDSGAYERGSPAWLFASNGTPQSAVINTAFAAPLEATVSDLFGGPLDGVSVTFTPPGSGASATITGSPATTNASGIASATATANGIAGGPYDVTATANGLSAKYSLTNLTALPTTTTLIASNDSLVAGQSVQLFAVVIAASGTPTGTATFKDGATTLGTSALDGGGIASLWVAALSVGAHNLTATYNGSPIYAASTSDPLSLPVYKANTTTTITTSTPNPSVVGQPVTVNYAVTVNAPGNGTPTGNVTISDGAGTTCTATVAAGGCTLTFTSTGVKTLTATYAGDANFNGSTSAGASHRVNVALFLPLMLREAQ